MGNYSDACRFHCRRRVAVAGFAVTLPETVAVVTVLSYDQLRQVWLSAAAGTKYATEEWANLMAAIGLAESGGRTNALNPDDNNGTQTSWGTWQISLGNHNPPSRNWSDPYVNAKLAIGKLNSQGLSAWGTYTSGAYKKYLGGRNVPNPGSAGGSGGGNVLTGFNPAGSLVSGLLSSLGIGSAKDALIRLGLIVLGGALIIVGVLMLVGKTAAATAITVAVPESRAAQAASGATVAAARQQSRKAASEKGNST